MIYSSSISKDKTCLFLLIVTLIQFSFSSSIFATKNISDSIPKGVVVDTILCKANPKFSYALYLPTKYNENKLWPIIYVFDPVANGKIEANLYKDAAEKYGYIVVCSNNSKNGPWDKNDEAIKYTIEDAEIRFAYDKRRVYTSGYSGGARLASRIALNSQKIAGVIGYCAGFPPKIMYNTSQIKGFDYIGLIGKRDYNYFELLELEKTLHSKGLSARLLISELNHELPSKESIMTAIEWMEFNAMKRNLCLKNDTLIQSLFKNYIKEISESEKNNNKIEEVRVFKYLCNDFSALMDISMYKAKLDSIIKTKDYIHQTKEEADIYTSEQKMVDNYYNLSRNLTRLGAFTDSIMYWWIGETNRLKKIEDGSSRGNKYMASRLLRTIFNIHMEQGNKFYENTQYDLAISSFKICCSAAPNIRYAYYYLACTQALNKNSGDACKTLEKLVELGFKNKKVLESEPSFEGLKNKKRFIEIMNSLE